MDCTVQWWEKVFTAPRAFVMHPTALKYQSLSLQAQFIFSAVANIYTLTVPSNSRLDASAR